MVIDPPNRFLWGNFPKDCMNSSLSKKMEKPFSLKLFVINVAGFFLAYNVLVGAIMWKFFPDRWTLQLLSTHTSSLFWTFVGMSLLNAFVEYPFHRYTLHARVVPFLSRFYKQHTLHHGLTHIVLRKSTSMVGTGAPLWVIENKFPITEPKQHEASFFPWYAFIVFVGLSTFLFVAVQWVFPKVPIFLGGSLGLASSLSLYEILHAMQHWPLQKWEPLLTHRSFGKVFRLIYSYHLGHHANILCNESISGFFGLPVADWVFGTLVLCPTLFEDGKVAGEKEIQFKAPRPARFISFLDTLAEKSLHRQKAL